MQRQRLQHSQRGLSSEPKDTHSLEHFKRSFPKRFFVRLHMTVLLFLVCSSGLIASKLLLELGLRSMTVRYLIAVCISYAVFFLLIRIWLWYVGVRRKARRRPSIDLSDGVDLIQLPSDFISNSVGSSGGCDIAMGGNGGDFGGGGATDFWGENGSVASTSSATGRGSTSGGSGGWGFDFDLGDDGIILIALLLLLAVIFGAAGYLAYAAPEILSAAAFEALLAAGLIRASRKISRQGWVGSVFKATCLPFVIVLLVTGLFGWIVQKHSPHATHLTEVFKHPEAEQR